MSPSTTRVARRRSPAHRAAGLDALELGAEVPARAPARRIWAAAWPKLAAVVLAIGIWQLVVWSGWKPEYVLASPADALRQLWELVTDGTLWTALASRCAGPSWASPSPW